MGQLPKSTHTYILATTADQYRSIYSQSNKKNNKVDALIDSKVCKHCTGKRFVLRSRHARQTEEGSEILPDKTSLEK